MKRTLLPIVAALAALVLPSCLQQHTTITLNKDGSGTIVEETTFGAQMSAMLGGLGGADAKDPLTELVSEEKTKARAAKLGEGVTLEKAEPINADGKKGARVTYRFADINKVKFTDSSDAMGEALGEGMPQPEGADKPDAKKDRKPTTFKYADGVLTITNPDDEKAAAPKEGEAKEDEEAPGGAEAAQMEGMMKAMMADMKISLKLVVAGGIAETNATNVEGDTITLAEMDMGKVLETPGAFKKMQDAGQDSTKAMEALKDVKGVKFEAKKEVTVKVK